MVVANIHNYNTAYNPPVMVWVLSANDQQEISDFVASIGEYRQQFEIPLDAIAEAGAVFKNLVDQWHVERGATSSVTDMIACPAYYKIIGLGPKAIDFIL